MSAATLEDLANVIKLLERLRTGELNVIPSIAGIDERKQDASTEMLERVEAVLRGAYKKAEAPLGDGGPAFPCFEYTEGHGPSRRNAQGEWENYATGATLRDWFAAKALQGIMVNAVGLGQMDAGERAALLAGTATLLYEIAGAMLVARSQS